MGAASLKPPEEHLGSQLGSSPLSLLALPLVCQKYLVVEGLRELLSGKLSRAKAEVSDTSQRLCGEKFCGFCSSPQRIYSTGRNHRAQSGRAGRLQCYLIANITPLIPGNSDKELVLHRTHRGADDRDWGPVTQREEHVTCQGQWTWSLHCRAWSRDNHIHPTQGM